MNFTWDFIDFSLQLFRLGNFFVVGAIQLELLLLSETVRIEAQLVVTDIVSPLQRPLNSAIASSILGQGCYCYSIAVGISTRLNYAMQSESGVTE